MQRRPTLKWVCHCTVLYIPKLKFIATTRNMLWTKEHITRQDCALWMTEKTEQLGRKVITWKELRLKGIKKIFISCSRCGLFCFIPPSLGAKTFNKLKLALVSNLAENLGPLFEEEGAYLIFPKSCPDTIICLIHHLRVNTNTSCTMYKSETTWRKLYIFCCLVTRPQNGGRGEVVYSRESLTLNFDR